MGEDSAEALRWRMRLMLSVCGSEVKSGWNVLA